jgi:hypothetical protein
MFDMMKTYQGSCHCGTVRYQADLDLAEGTIKCNCSICRKERNWLAAVKPGAFRLLEGESALSEYQFGAKRIHHMFCKHCGVSSFSKATGADGQPMHVVKVNCLDNADDQDLADAPVMFINGREDDFKSPPRETRYL